MKTLNYTKHLKSITTSKLWYLSIILLLAVSVSAGTIEKRVVDTSYIIVDDTALTWVYDTTYIDIEVGSADCDTCEYRERVEFYIDDLCVGIRVRDSQPPETTIVCDTVAWINRSWRDFYGEWHAGFEPCYICDTTITEGGE